MIEVTCRECKWIGTIAELKTLRSHPAYGVKAICPACGRTNEVLPPHIPTTEFDFECGIVEGGKEG